MQVAMTASAAGASTSEIVMVETPLPPAFGFKNSKNTRPPAAGTQLPGPVPEVS